MRNKLMKWGLLSLVACLVLGGCNDSKVDPPSGNLTPSGNLNGVIHIQTLDDYTSANHIYMLDRGESEEIMFGPTRQFNPRYPVQITITENQELLLRAFSPRKITNLKIWATLAEYPEQFLLAQFDIVPPFLEFSQKLPIADASKYYMTRNGKRIQIMENPHISAADLTLEIECDDKYYQMFSKIKTDWWIEFSDYGKSGAWQWPMKPAHCREAVAMSINFAYMISSPEYEQLMRDYNGQFYGNGNAPNNGPLIPDNQILIDQSRAHYGGIKWGHVTGLGGLGGGKVIGLTESGFIGHYADDMGECIAWFHEHGHGMGYGDSNNTVISNDGGDTPSWRKVCQELYRQMCIDKKLPIYSRRFMNTRRYADLYSPNGQSYQRGRVIIEDPELDEIDGGLARGKEFLADDYGDSKGEALNFKLTHEDAGMDAKNYIPSDIYVHGDKLYVTNDANGNRAFEIYDLSKGKPVFLKRITQWTDPDEKKTITPQGAMSILHSNGKIFVSGGTTSYIYVFDANSYECISRIWAAQMPVVGLGASNGVLYSYRNEVKAFPEHLIPNKGGTPCLATLGWKESDSRNGMVVDNESNVYAISFAEKKMAKVASNYLMAGNISIEKEIPLEYNPSGAAWSEDGRMFVIFANTDKKFCEVDPATGKILKDYTTIGDIKLDSPKRCVIRRNTLFITDQGSEKCVYAIPLSELN